MLGETGRWNQTVLPQSKPETPLQSDAEEIDEPQPKNVLKSNIIIFSLFFFTKCNILMKLRYYVKQRLICHRYPYKYDKFAKGTITGKTLK